MTITLKQFNKIALKEDLKNLATKNEINSFKDEILTAVGEIKEIVSKNSEEKVANQGAHN